jgi:OmpA-OmpF porin, OOP family
MKTALLAGALGAALLQAAVPAFAQTTTTSGTPGRSWLPLTSYGYVGGNAGWSDYKDASCSAGFGCDRDDLGFKLYTGGQLWRWVGLELSYVHVGRAEVNGGKLRAQGANLSLVGNLPIADRFNLFGKVGSTYGWTRTSAAAPGVTTGSEQGVGLSYGAGVGIDLARNWQLRAEWDRYRFDFKGPANEVDLYSVGVAYKF